jgi:hypothetical protein
MTVQFAIIDADGYPQGFGAHPHQVPEGAVPIGANENLAEYAKRRWFKGQWHDRPVIPAPEVDQDMLFLDGFPSDAEITLVDAITGVPLDVPERWAGGVAMRLPQGSYHLTITAPPPWLPFEGLIDIAGGSPQRVVDQLRRDQQAARAKVNERAGRSRLGLVTDIPGQMAIYQAKEAEARAWLADAAPQLADYPLIAAEVGITAPTGSELAQLWLNMAHIFRLAAAASERARMQALAAVDAEAMTQIAEITSPQGRDLLRKGALE